MCALHLARIGEPMIFVSQVDAHKCFSCYACLSLDASVDAFAYLKESFFLHRQRASVAGRRECAVYDRRVRTTML